MPIHDLQKVAEPRLFRAFVEELSFYNNHLGLGGAAYRTRTCDPRITKARVAFWITYMFQ